MRTFPALVSLLLLAACGDDAADGADAGPPLATDAAPADGPVADAAPASPIVVVAFDGDGALDPGVTILVHDRDGAMVGRAATDAVGRATVAVPAGGQVTAVQRAATRRQVTTVTDVQAGDQLQFGVPTRTRVAHQVQLSLPAHPDPDAASYQVLSSCGGFAETTTRSATLTFEAACPSQLVQFVVIARTADDLALGFDRVVADPRTGGAFSGTYAELRSLRLTVRADTDFQVTALRPVGHEALLPLAVRGRRDGTVDVPLIGAGGGVSLRVTDGRDQTRLVQRFATAPARVAVDLSTAPDLGAAIVDGRSVRWSNGGGSSTEGIIVTMARAAEPAVEWNVVAPASAVSLLIPSLPSDLADLSPLGAGASPPVVRAFDVSWSTDWPAFRQRGHRDALRYEDVIGSRLEDTRALVATSPSPP